MAETRQAVLAGQACCAGENPVHKGQAQDVQDAKKTLVLLATIAWARAMMNSDAKSSSILSGP